MDVVATSLEALIQRATNPQNEKPDVAAIEAFSVMLGKESKAVHVASRLLATHVQSNVEKEALQALTLLDTCMKRCGRSFHAEIGKFRFLNVLIKLVSPKYLGDKTAVSVRHKILELLYAWTSDYPREMKIKETYEMLKKQGIIQESVSPVQNIADCPSKLARGKNPIFEDEEKTKLLQELLRSKDPFDLKLANKLIKSMVKDDEKRVQLNSQRNMELESVHVNVKLLSEMLDLYDPSKSSSEDVELMRELYDACERLKPTVTRLAYESQDNDDTIGEVLAANDQLSQVLEKYASVMVLGRGVGSSRLTAVANSASASLLDLSSPIDSSALNDLQSSFGSNKKTSELVSNNSKTDMDMLGDIFNSSPIPDARLVFPDANIMQPISVLPALKTKELASSTVKLDGKAKALEDLNQLGESMLKESLSQAATGATKSSLSNVSKLTKEIAACTTAPSSLRHVNPSPSNVSILGGNVDRSTDNTLTPAANGLSDKSMSNDLSNDGEEACDFVDLLNNDDDAMLDASFTTPKIKGNRSTNYDDNENDDDDDKPKGASPSSSMDEEIKPITDIHVTIHNIKPGTTPPLTVIEDKNGISVVLHFAKGSPRPDVTVIVVTTTSKNSKALSNYLFQAVVPKQCKCRLQVPSDTKLPGHNPFLPPAAITHIMLIANPQKYPLSLKFMLSYTMEDETFTEMGEVDKLPSVN